jgi:hypothetical protein
MHVARPSVEFHREYRMFKNEPSSKKRFLTTTETELELATNSGRKISELLAKRTID